MLNPYFQVARTYLRRPFHSLSRSLFTSFILVFSVIVLLRSGLSEKHELQPIHLFPFIALFAYWAIHVKEQFADTRASLTPVFRKIHGVVATIAAIVFVIILPGVLAPLIGLPSLGFVSISTLLFSVILWYNLRPSNTFFLFMVVGFIFMIHKPVFNAIVHIFSGKEPIQAFIIISIGVILSIAGIIRLFLLNEEIPEYHLNIKKNMDGRTELSNLQWRKLDKSYSWGWWRRLVNRLGVRMIYHARHATDSYWSRMHRWTYSNRSVWYALFHATFLNLFLILIYFLTDGNFLPGIRIGVATLVPIFLLNRQFNEKSRFMAQDLMMPVRRDAYLKQVGMSFATSQFIQWGVYMTVTVLLMFTSVAKTIPEFLIISISYSVMIHVGLFGLAIWTSSFRSTLMNFLFLISAFFLVIFTFMSAFKPQMTVPRWPLVLGALLVCLGLLLTWWGYRRWLVADFD